jgi:hypothetical protein
MRIIESAPSEEDQPYFLISEYVTHGGMVEPNHIEYFTKLLQKLEQILPPSDKITNARALYRGLIINPEQKQNLEQGLPLRLSPRLYASWSRSLVSAKRVLTERLRGMRIMHNPGSGIVVHKKVIPAQILLDVEAWYIRNHLNVDGIQEWSYYVKPEKEVIVRNNDYYLEINPNDIVNIVAG